ncbi:MAG: PorT family protein [Chitinophagaceae bacterium]|nr:PorT family protein [Chitinophagaceae bacterium]
MKTRRRITSAALCFLMILVAFTSQSQTTSTAVVGRTVFGIKGGVNLSNLYVDEINDENAKFGFQVGGFVKAGLSDNFAIQPELIYSQKGAELDYNNIFASGKVALKLHYIELPVMAVVNLGPINIQAGPYVSYLAAVSVKNKGDNGDNFEEEIDKDNFESFDYGVAGGLGIDGNGVGFGIRYNYGLKEVGKERNFFGQQYRFPDAKNSVLQAYLTFGF